MILELQWEVTRGPWDDKVVKVSLAGQTLLSASVMAVMLEFHLEDIANGQSTTLLTQFLSLMNDHVTQLLKPQGVTIH